MANHTNVRLLCDAVTDISYVFKFPAVGPKVDYIRAHYIMKLCCFADFYKVKYQIY